jgi:sugar phosphate isomerase/epimerase
MQVHVKDAVASRVPGEWGTEVPVGEGSVEWADFFATLDAHELQPDWVIEREAGDQRIADVRQAAAVIDELH